MIWVAKNFCGVYVGWQDKHGGIIIEQLKRLGCSCDWSRRRYNVRRCLRPGCPKRFCRSLQQESDLSRPPHDQLGSGCTNGTLDEEVISKPQKRKSLLSSLQDIGGRAGALSRSRQLHQPEDSMADTAMAFHPNDKRYVDLLGKHAWRPLAREKIPIIADEVIDPEFGTGVLKVTPAHDTLGGRNWSASQLARCRCLAAGYRRTNCPAVPELNGLDRFEARKRAGELLKEKGLLSKTEPYENNVGFSQRSDVPIEPRISEQWFLRYPKTEEALAVVGNHLIRFFPGHWEKVYAQWLENVHEWCISRQVWWGHRIPAWYRKSQVQLPGPKFTSELTLRAIRKIGRRSRHTRYVVFILALGLCDDR